MELSNLYYHGIREQIRRVLTLLGEERVDKGLTAFEDGGSNWGSCFFARALAPERLSSEFDVCRILGLVKPVISKSHGLNVVPVRILYHTFDGCSKLMTKKELCDFIVYVRDESRPDEVMQLLRSLDYTGVEETPVEMVGSCSTEGKWSTSDDMPGAY